MATLIKHTKFASLLVVLLSVCGLLSAETVRVGTRESVGLEIDCREVEVRITVKRQFFEERRIPFRPEYLRLGTQQRPCGPKGPMSDSEMVISAGLQECGTESSVREGG